MTAAALIASLPADRDRALEELEGALKYGEWAPEDRQELVRARAELMQAQKRGRRCL